MTEQQNHPHAGLCEECYLGSRVTSSRGSTFFLCKQSLVDPNYPRYPRLPVLQCEAYKPLAREAAPGDENRLP